MNIANRRYKEKLKQRNILLHCTEFIESVTSLCDKRGMPAIKVDSFEDINMLTIPVDDILSTSQTPPPIPPRGTSTPSKQSPTPLKGLTMPVNGISTPLEETSTKPRVKPKQFKGISTPSKGTTPHTGTLTLLKETKSPRGIPTPLVLTLKMAKSSDNLNSSTMSSLTDELTVQSRDYPTDHSTLLPADTKRSQTEIKLSQSKEPPSVPIKKSKSADNLLTMDKSHTRSEMPPPPTRPPPSPTRPPPTPTRPPPTPTRLPTSPTRPPPSPHLSQSKEPPSVPIKKSKSADNLLTMDKSHTRSEMPPPPTRPPPSPTRPPPTPTRLPPSPTRPPPTPPKNLKLKNKLTSINVVSTSSTLPQTSATTLMSPASITEESMETAALQPANNKPSSPSRIPPPPPKKPTTSTSPTQSPSNKVIFSTTGDPSSSLQKQDVKLPIQASCFSFGVTESLILARSSPGASPSKEIKSPGQEPSTISPSSQSRIPPSPTRAPPLLIAPKSPPLMKPKSPPVQTHDQDTEQFNSRLPTSPIRSSPLFMNPKSQQAPTQKPSALTKPKPPTISTHGPQVLPLSPTRSPPLKTNSVEETLATEENQQQNIMSPPQNPKTKTLQRGKAVRQSPNRPPQESLLPTSGISPTNQKPDTLQLPNQTSAPHIRQTRSANDLKILETSSDMNPKLLPERCITPVKNIPKRPPPPKIKINRDDHIYTALLRSRSMDDMLYSELYEVIPSVNSNEDIKSPDNLLSQHLTLHKKNAGMIQELTKVFEMKFTRQNTN